MHIFDNLYEQQRKLEEERHRSLLKKLNISEEEYQFREKKRKEEAAKRLKEEEKKERIRGTIIIGAIFLLLFAIAYFTHWGPLAMFDGFILGLFLLVFVSFFLIDYLVKIKIFSWLDKASNIKYIVFLLLGIVIGWFSFVETYHFLIYEEGDNQVVYITPHGGKYHLKKNCPHIKGHIIMRTTLGVIKRSKSPCETCTGQEGGW